MRVIGLILAGGSGSRLGHVDKARLRIGGEPLIDRVTQRLAGHAERVIVSVGPAARGTGDADDDIADLALPVAGPLAGLAAAVAALSPEENGDTALVSVAVDTPFLPPDYVPRLLAALEQGHAAAQAGWRSNAYPTNAAWMLSAISDLPERLAHGADLRSPKQLLAALSAPLVDWSDGAEEDPFANLNTPEDLVSLARREAHPGS